MEEDISYQCTAPVILSRKCGDFLTPLYNLLVPGFPHTHNKLHQWINLPHGGDQIEYLPTNSLQQVSFEKLESSQINISFQDQTNLWDHRLLSIMRWRLTYKNSHFGDSMIVQSGMRISITKIRQFWDNVIIMMGIPILVRKYLLASCRLTDYNYNASLKSRFMPPTWGHLGLTGPRWAPCWPHELCDMGCTGQSI